MPRVARKFPPNLALRVAIVQSGRRQGAIAKSARLGRRGHLRLSKIVGGWVQPTEKEQARIAKVLRRSPAELFPAAVS